MTEADARLAALFAGDAPPARDPDFSTAVMERLARRRWLEDLALLAGLSAVGGAALWGLWPALQPTLAALSGALAPAAALLAAALWGAALLGGRPAGALGAES